MMPILNSLHDGNPRIRLVEIDAGESPAPVIAFSNEMHIDDPIMDPNLEVNRAYGAAGYPLIVLVDPNGKIAGKWYGYNPKISSLVREAILLPLQ